MSPQARREPTQREAVTLVNYYLKFCSQPGRYNAFGGSRHASADHRTLERILNADPRKRVRFPEDRFLGRKIPSALIKRASYFMKRYRDAVDLWVSAAA